MKVGLNATCLNDRPSGAKRRFVGIYGALFAIAPEVEFVVYEPADCDVASWFPDAANVTAIKTPIPSEGRVAKALRGMGYWRGELASQKFDIFEGFNLPLVVAPGASNLVTVHDLRGLQPEAGFFERLAFRFVLDRALKHAAHVVTVSESMKKAIGDVHPGARVSVVYNGLGDASAAPIPAVDMAAFRAKCAIEEGYVLAVGHMEARKNYPRLVDAMARLRDHGFRQSLVIIGNDSGERHEVEKRIQANGLGGRVHLLSGLSDMEVRCAYALCGLFVFPSSYEGFGIPILEAMAAGRPMVLSDIEVFREITQQQGVYFSPADSSGMAAAMEQVLASPELQERIISYGKRRINDFTYEQLAHQMKALYQSLMKARQAVK